MNAQVEDIPKLKRNKAGQIMPGTGGRPKGVPNKTTITLNQAVLLAAAQAGDKIKAGSGLVGYLKHIAETEPKAFTGLLGRTLPLDVTSSDGSMRPLQSPRIGLRQSQLPHLRPHLPALPFHARSSIRSISHDVQGDNMTTETFNHADRAGFLERMGRLAGQTTFREPSGGGSPYSARMMTTENAMVLALSFARRDKRDIGPEIVYAIATGIPHRRERVVSWLAIKIMRAAGPKGRKAQNYINILAQHCYELVAFGKQTTKLPARLPVCWDDLVKIGSMGLWVVAESTIERAEYAHRSEGVADASRDKRPSGAVSAH